MGLWGRPGKSGYLRNCQNPQLFVWEQLHSELIDLERASPALIGPLNVDVASEVQERLVGEALRTVGLGKVFSEKGGCAGVL